MPSRPETVRTVTSGAAAPGGRKRSLFLLLGCLFLLGQAPGAAAVDYHAEIIVFGALDPDSSEGPSASGGTAPEPGGRFPEAARSLGAIAERLQQSSQYRVLAHAAWTQPDLPPRQGRPVAIAAEDDRIGILDGTVELRRQQVMVAELDLWLEDPLTRERYRLHQVRRMRSGELHYFDHPRFGVIMEIDVLP